MPRFLTVEPTFLRLLEDVRPGVRHDDPPQGTPPRAASRNGTPSAPRPRPEPQSPMEPPARPTSQANAQPRAGTASPARLAGRRVLVLGGTHPQAAAARARVVELGGAAAVNLSASVTDVVALPGAGTDRRMGRITDLRIPVHDEGWLRSAAHGSGPADRPPSPVVLPLGAVVDLPVTAGAATWTITASWGQRTGCEIDVVAFAVDEDEQVSGDGDFVFYGAPDSPGNGIRLSTDGPTEQSVTVDLSVPPPQVRKVVVAAAIGGGAAFGDVGAVEITAGPGVSEALLAQATLDAATTERTLLLAEIYRRGPSWRLRAIGQGYDSGLAALARRYGVDVED